MVEKTGTDKATGTRPGEITKMQAAPKPAVSLAIDVAPEHLHRARQHVVASIRNLVLEASTSYEPGKLSQAMSDFGVLQMLAPMQEDRQASPPPKPDKPYPFSPKDPSRPETREEEAIRMQDRSKAQNARDAQRAVLTEEKGLPDDEADKMLDAGDKR